MVGGVGMVRLSVPGVNSGDVAVAKANAGPFLAPDCDRSLSLGMRGSVEEIGGAGGYPRSGGRKPGGGAGGGTVGNAPPETSPTPVAGLCGCCWKL